FHVTGVQTCALPIWAAAGVRRRPAPDRRHGKPPLGQWPCPAGQAVPVLLGREGSSPERGGRGRPGRRAAETLPYPAQLREGRRRSEERRAGQEGRRG